MARFSSPPQPAFDNGDNPDPAAEAGQRTAAATQAVQGVLSTWALHSQRDMSHQRAAQARRRTDDRSDERRSHDAYRNISRPLRQETREAGATAVRPLSMLDAGLDSLGPGSVLSETQQNQVRRRFEVVPGGGDITERTEQLRGADAADAADEAAESGAVMAAADGTPATIALLGGTNRRAARTARVREALGDVREVAAVEAQAGREDPLTAAGDDDALGHDPLTANAWDEPPVTRGRQGTRDR